MKTDICNNRRSWMVFAFIVLLGLNACNLASLLPASATSTPTAQPSPTVKPIPAATDTPQPTETPAPSPTSIPSPTPIPATPTMEGLPLPTGEPIADWEGIPIMPGALAGAESEGDYFYSVQASPQEIQDFYERELADLGWESFATGTGDTGNLFLMFMKGDQMATISAIVQGEVTLILIIVQ